MIKKNFLLFIGFILLIAVAGPEAQAGGKTIPINLRFSGAFMNNIEHDVDPAPGLTTATSALIHTTARGRPGGWVEIRGFSGRSGNGVFGGCAIDGGIGPFLAIPVLENPLVMTFLNLSLLFANSPDETSGSICIDLATGKSTFEINIVFVGGRGRFAGATGSAVIRGEAEPVDSRGNFQGETGTIRGTIMLP